ncbi:hypothetical protein BUALT_Bualt07G0028200 [Buddleja alternifolia]|uniref:Uncharacterized protein n=1 Tax=Buddleja alternifolia TaxID=168488 RepID=A0AAV6XED8_9LAMI|nr:hypothetical protein BUALT_Bualt07G0028200 [Buddleja alternifolia]
MIPRKLASVLPPLSINSCWSKDITLDGQHGSGTNLLKTDNMEVELIMFKARATRFTSKNLVLPGDTSIKDADVEKQLCTDPMDRHVSCCSLSNLYICNGSRNFPSTPNYKILVPRKILFPQCHILDIISYGMKQPMDLTTHM